MAEPAEKKVFIVRNPASGAHQAPALRDALVRALMAAGWQYAVHDTARGEIVTDAVHQARQAGYTTFAAIGGDGTVATVAAGLVDSPCRLAIVPAGTGNVLARALGIGKDPRRAIGLLLGPHRLRHLDAIQIEDRIYLLAISAGLSSLVIARSEHHPKRLLGRLAYGTAAIPHFLRMTQYRYTLDIDDQTYASQAADVMVVNTSATGYAGIHWGPNIEPDDGELGVCIFGTHTPLHYGRLIFRALCNDHLKDGDMQVIPARHQVTITAEPPVPVEADGELIGMTPVHATVIPHAVTIVVPPQI